MRKVWWVFFVFAAASSTGCTRPDPNCGQAPGECSAETSYCQFSPGYDFLENGNPIPLPGFVTDRYRCQALPERCAEGSCDCLSCQGDFVCDGPDCECQPVLGNCAEPAEEGDLYMLTIPKE